MQIGDIAQHAALQLPVACLARQRERALELQQRFVRATDDMFHIAQLIDRKHSSRRSPSSCANCIAAT